MSNANNYLVNGKRDRSSSSDRNSQSKSNIDDSSVSSDSRVGDQQESESAHNMSDGSQETSRIRPVDRACTSVNKSGVGQSSTTASGIQTQLQPQSSKSLSEANQAEADQEAEKGSSKGSKTNRSSFRKGKWTVEEEEYTSRIIQHFSAGLLSLPESATLRSYLSDKLNCDPMRITKKFTGACCLGRRAYQLRDRPRATPAEVEMAKIELDHLEQRFRLRVEHEQSGLPLSRRQELLIAQPQANGGSGTLFSVQSCPPVAAAASVTSNPWLSNYAGVSGVPVNTSSLFMGSPANHSIQSVAAGMPVNPQSLFISLAGNRPMQPLPSASNPLRITSTTDGAQTDPSKILNNIVASWAWAQTAASFSPALSQVGYPRPANLANSIVGMHQLQQKGQHKLQQETEELERKQRSEEHQRQLRSAYEEQKQKEVQRQLQAAYENERQKVEATEKAVSPSTFPSSHSTSHTPSEVTPAQQLFRSYAAHLESLKEKERRESSKSKPMFVEDEKKLPTADQPIRKTRLSASAASKSEVLPSSNAENLWSNGREDGCSIAAGMEESCDGATLKDIKSVQSDYEQQRRAEGDEACGTEDEEAGTILWGFLNSLRESYEDAVEQKANSSSANDAKVRLTLLEEEKYSKKQKKSSRPSGKPRTSISPTSSSSSTELPEMLKPAKRAEKRSRDTGSSGETEKDASVQITPAPRFRATSSRIPPASITDTSTLSRSEISSGASSQPTEFSSSSLEDSDCKSDKTDPSSSEESEKDCTLLNRGASKGPPRKRLKACKPVEKVKEFTTQNLMEHSKRMSQEFDDAENGNY